MLRRIAASFALTAAIAACSLGALDGFSGGGETNNDGGGDSPEGGSDTPPPDSSPGDPAAEAGVDASVPPSLVDNGAFEEGIAGCGPGWRADRTTLTRSTTARGGHYSCLVCIVPGNTIGNVFPLNDVLLNAKKDQTFYAEAWVAAPPSGPSGTMAMQLLVDSANVDYAQVEPQPAWQKVQLQGKASIDGELNFALRITVDSTSDSGCYLVDEVVVLQQ